MADNGGIIVLTVLFEEVTVAKRKAEDPKVESLAGARALNPRPGAVTDEGFATEEFLDPRDLVQVKYEMVRRVRVEGDAVSGAAGAFGFSRPSWYAAAAALDRGGCPPWSPSAPGRAGPTSSATRWSPSPLEPYKTTRRCDRPTWSGSSKGASRSRSIPAPSSGPWPSTGGDPKAAPNEIPVSTACGDDRAGSELIEAYQQLRAAALARGGASGGLGAGLLMGKGMSAWIAAWAALPAPRLPASPAVMAATAVTAASPEVVSVLASMALSCVG